MRQRVSKYIVIDSLICHGKATFTGTRIMVWQVLDQLARGMSWDEIDKEWDGKVNFQSISDALKFAGKLSQASFSPKRKLPA